MKAALSLWQVAVWAACSHLSAADVPDHPDAPSPDKYMRRIHPRAVVIGDYIYIDGGAVNKENITEDWSINPPGRAVGSTLSIDLTERWSPDDVVMNPTSKADEIPLMHSGGLFLNPNGDGAFYAYGGIQAFVSSPPDREDLWKFRADGNGSGTWITETPSNGNFFNAMIRTSLGAWVSTPDAGFWIGGDSDARTTRMEANRGPITGILSYNFTNQAWSNDSSADLSPDGTLYAASATFVPNFGPNGVIVVLGGTSRFGREGEGHQPMDNIKFFDPVTKEVFRQTTTGRYPSERRLHCAVGAEGPNNTYEIFVYGGVTLHSDGENVDEVWVLSLPGFFWTKADYEPQFPRVGHTCVTAGNRQLVSIGGFNNNGLNNSAWWRVKDNFSQGLGVFDLTELQWKDSFDPTAERYESPDAVKAWYNDNDIKDIEWTSSDVKALFVETNPNPPGSGEGSSPGGDDNNDDKEGASTPVAAIAGGVVGGVVGVAIVGVIFWFCRRRRRQGRDEDLQSQALQGSHHDASKTPHSSGAEMFADTPQLSQAGTPSPGGWYGPPAQTIQPVKPVQTPQAELQGTSYVHEMDGTSSSPRHY